MLSRLIIGLQPPVVARLLNCFLSVCFYLFLATNVTITVFRIVLVTKVNNNYSNPDNTPPLSPSPLSQPDKFWNADHEKLYRRILILLVFLSSAAVISVEVIMSSYYQGENKTLKLPPVNLLVQEKPSLTWSSI